MDGTVISGCGNIYATEALFRMKIHPKRAASRISRKRISIRPVAAIVTDLGGVKLCTDAKRHSRSLRPRLRK
jgi:formamidopyrimidine-DNA glycosylase